jgi:hypothetical protein
LLKSQWINLFFFPSSFPWINQTVSYHVSPYLIGGVRAIPVPSKLESLKHCYCVPQQNLRLYTHETRKFYAQNRYVNLNKIKIYWEDKILCK